MCDEPEGLLVSRASMATDISMSHCDGQQEPCMSTRTSHETFCEDLQTCITYPECGWSESGRCQDAGAHHLAGRDSVQTAASLGVACARSCFILVLFQLVWNALHHVVCLLMTEDDWGPCPVEEECSSPKYVSDDSRREASTSRSWPRQHSHPLLKPEFCKPFRFKRVSACTDGHE